MFADFADFDFYRLQVDWAHLVAGFGRIDRLAKTDLIEPLVECGEVIEAEYAIVRHMNEDHAPTIGMMAVALAGAEAAAAAGPPWSMVGCDLDGVDLAAGDRAARVEFSRRVGRPDDMRRELITLARDARERLTRANV